MFFYERFIRISCAFQFLGNAQKIHSHGIDTRYGNKCFLVSLVAKMQHRLYLHVQIFLFFIKLGLNKAKMHRGTQ